MLTQQTGDDSLACGDDHAVPISQHSKHRSKGGKDMSDNSYAMIVIGAGPGCYVAAIRGTHPRILPRSRAYKHGAGQRDGARLLV